MARSPRCLRDKVNAGTLVAASSTKAHKSRIPATPSVMPAPVVKSTHQSQSLILEFARAVEELFRRLQTNHQLKMGVAFQTIGMIGSFVIASSLVPQMRKVYKTKSAKDISLRFQLLYCFGIGLILIYGFGENLWPIYIPASVEEIAGLVMLGMKLYYDRNAVKLGASGADDEGHTLDLGASPLTRRGETKFKGVMQTP